jgi:hypothetical protein
MSLEYAYYYARILENGMCIEVIDDTSYIDEPDHIPIPEYNRAYLLKYYNRADGKWYTDAAFTNEATELNG